MITGYVVKYQQVGHPNNGKYRKALANDRFTEDWGHYTADLSEAVIYPSSKIRWELSPHERVIDLEIELSRLVK